MLSIFFRSWILRSNYLSSKEEKENPRLLSTSSIKSEIGKFHVGVVQRSTAKKWTKLLFCQSFLPFSLPSPSSLLKLPNVSSRPLKKVLWKLRSPRGYFRKFSLSSGVQNSGNVFQSNVSFLFYSYRDLVLSLAAVFLDVTQRSLGERCVTSQKRLRGRLGIWLLSVFSGTAIERWLKKSLESPFETSVPGSDKTVLQSSASSSQLRSREIFLYASQLLAG